MNLIPTGCDINRFPIDKIPKIVTVWPTTNWLNLIDF